MTAPRLEEYRDVAPRGAIELLLKLAERLQGRRFVHVNASRYGSGSSEILARLVPLLQDLGVDATWEVIVGDPAFYAATRAIETALGGQPAAITEAMLVSYVEAAATNAATLRLESDLVMVHDLPALPLVRHRPERGRWVWRCHADLSRAWRRAWHLVRRDLERYDTVVYSMPKFAQRVRVPMLVVHPSIDPLGEKNRELGRSEVREVLDRLGIPRDKPLLLQVAAYSRAAEPTRRAHRVPARAKVRAVPAGAGRVGRNGQPGGQRRPRRAARGRRSGSGRPRAGDAARRRPGAERAPARGDGGPPPAAAGGLRPDGGRGDVEGQAGRRQRRGRDSRPRSSPR